ncbi:MAG: insulinase family protein [Acidobacteria bacterium]|nr:insulinase family protein [Acidobacteriota bacterium]
MMLSRRLHTSLVVVGAVAASAFLAGQQPTPAAVHGSPATAALESRIPPDPQIRIGTLGNGLRYYVRRNARPVGRAELRLVVNAGSVLEDDDQRGLAHFVEHMAFNGTENFPRQEMVTFLESIGMRFGPSVNAFTSFDETVYMLQVPTGNAEVLDRALLILEDWAHNVAFDPAEIDKERGVVIEEWRGRRGAAARLQDRQIPVLLAGSRYVERLPIGTTAVLETFAHDRLVQFYRDWYRPDLMAVIAVGDFDPAAMEERVRARFARVPEAPTARPRTAHTVPARTTPAFLVLTDPEQTTTQVRVDTVMPAQDESTIAAYRANIVEGLFAGMLSARFNEIVQKPGAPFLGAGAGRTSVVRTAEALSLVATVRDGGIEQGLEALFVETERVTGFGFTTAELARQKVNVARSVERAVAERDNQQSADLAAEFSRNYLQNEPIPGIAYEHELYQRFLPTITLEEVNALARTWSPAASRMVMVTAPEKPGLTMPTDARLAEVIAAAPAKATTPWVDETPTAALLAAPPAPGSITGTNVRAEVGITEWTLSNGAKVVLKPTGFKQDEITFRAFSPGGSSLASDEDWVPASTAAQVIAAGGVGDLSVNDLRRVLAGVAASVAPSISMYEEGLSGGGSPKDLEKLFQLIYLRFTQPRADAQIFDVIRDQTKAALANQAASPAYAFSETLNDVMTQGHPRGRSITPELVDQMNLQRSLAFYRDRFADASDFTFVFVGTFTPEVMQPVVERYIASLPATRRQENWRDVGLRAPQGRVIERRVARGIEPRSQTQMIFTGPFEYTQDRRTAIRAMGMVLETRLRNVLREDLGGTYSVGVGVSYTRIPHQDYRVSISFGSDPARAEALQQRVLDEIEAFRRDGPSDRDVNDTREALLREFETGRTQNGYLLAQIAGRYQSGESVEGFFRIDETYRALSAAQIHDAARAYLNTASRVVATLVPEQ